MIDFIVKLLLNKHKGNVYDFILVIMDWYIKMVQYLSINVIIKFHKLDDLLMEKIFFCGLGAFMSIISDRDFVFISDY